MLCFRSPMVWHAYINAYIHPYIRHTYSICIGLSLENERRRKSPGEESSIGSSSRARHGVEPRHPIRIEAFVALRSRPSQIRRVYSPPLWIFLVGSLDLGLKSHRSVRNPDVMWGSPRFNLVVVPDMFLSFDRLLIILLFFSIYVTERTWWSKGGLLLLLIACGSVIVLIPIRALYLVTLLKITSFCWFTSWI